MSETPNRLSEDDRVNFSAEHSSILKFSIIENAYYRHHCVVSVIDPHYALTAAHCVTDGSGEKEITFFGGYAIGEELKTFSVQVTQALCHKDHVLRDLVADIAILEFKTPLPSQVEVLKMNFNSVHVENEVTSLF